MTRAGCWRSQKVIAREAAGIVCQLHTIYNESRKHIQMKHKIAAECIKSTLTGKRGCEKMCRYYFHLKSPVTPPLCCRQTSEFFPTSETKNLKIHIPQLPGEVLIVEANFARLFDNNTRNPGWQLEGSYWCETVISYCPLALQCHWQSGAAAKKITLLSTETILLRWSLFYI